MAAERTEQKERRKVSIWRFPGVWVCVAGMIQGIVGYGISSYGWTVFVRIFMRDFGWTAAMMGAVSSVGRITGVFAYPLGGWTTDRIGPRWASIIWLATLPVGWILVFFTTAYWHLFIAYSLFLQAGVGGGLYRVSWTGAVRWWVQRRAMGIGIITLGGGFGGPLIPLTALVVESLGWRQSALWLAGVSFIILTGVAFLYVSGFPEDYGLYEDNMTPEERERRVAGRRVTAQFATLSTAEALKTQAFWLIALGGAFASLAGGATGTFQNIRMGAVGYSLVAAAAFYGFNRIMTYVGRLSVTLLGDWISSRMQPRFVIGLSYVGVGIGMFFFAIGSADWHYYAWAIINGSFSGVITPYLGYIIGAYFGRQAFGLIYGLRTSLTAFGGMISPLLVGWLVDARKGDWVFPFLLLTGFYTGAAIFYSLATPPKQPDQEDEQS